METALSYTIEREYSDWEPIAWVDESESYEVDITEIWKRPDGKFMLVTATGCSCWSGEYEVEEYDSLDDIVSGILTRDDKYVYNPSLEGAKRLVEAAKAYNEDRLSQ